MKSLDENKPHYACVNFDDQNKKPLCIFVNYGQDQNI
jgi:hypothetical protein